MSSTRKTPHFDPTFSSPEADAAVAVVVAGAEDVEAVEVAAAAEAAVDVAGVEAAAGVEAFGSTVAAVVAWRVRDVQWAGGAFRRHLRISIRRRWQADRL